MARVRENIQWAAEKAASAGIDILIEALNSWESPRYLLTKTAEALKFIDSVGSANVRYQYDLYHMQRMEGNLVRTLHENIDRIGHIQIADSPHRGRPGTGEIAYTYILEELEKLPYRGFVGLEYLSHQGNSETSFAWLPRDKRTHGAASDLLLPR